MNTKCISRFAPSPTGRLHLGHAWSALQAHDLARAAGGQFLLRIEDIDTGRCRPEFVDGIKEDLNWLGLNWDGPVMIQSERFDVYRAALQTLIDQGLVYRCWCTRAEIAASAGAPQGDEGPIYPGACKGRAPPSNDRAYCWRLDTEKAGFLPQGDVVLARKDTPTSYHLSVTSDDAAQGVTDVVRGNDLREATHVHHLLQSLLGLPTPRYHHHALLAGPDGERLAKRHIAPTIQSLRKSGSDPLQLIDGMRRGRFPFGFTLMEA
jgi:glutamyl-Q tRNA(Asp) synthetase